MNRQGGGLLQRFISVAQQGWGMFSGSLIITVIGFAAAFLIGFNGVEDGSSLTFAMKAGLSTFFLVLVLSVLEISLSFDNAVVNASVLEKMTALWRHRFLTWGILIAVFGMRLVLPLAIVAVMAHVSPWDALLMAVQRPKDYAALMLSIHSYVAAFGGTFLLMVGIDYFLNEEKDVHWIQWIEGPLAKLGRIKSVEVLVAILFLLILAPSIPERGRMGFLISGLAGVMTYLSVDALGAILGSPPKDSPTLDPHKASVGMFLYLEVLDASFSFDGVVGAFALTHNLFLIAIGLGIGAMFVRSITIVLVEKKSLAEFKYLEHGAFWAILSLAALMFAGVFVHIPEVVTGLVGAIFIGLSIWTSTKTSPMSDPKSEHQTRQ